jgi:hypothetical protein
MVAKRENAGNSRPRRRPATTPEAREQQLGSMAFDLAEQQLLDGTASAQVITYFLKANSVRERKEIARLEHETRLAEAKIAQAGSANKMETLLEDAMKAFTEYKGGGSTEVEDDY